MSSEYTFVVEKICPVCGKSVKVVKIKSRLIAEHVDNDYCCHYRDFNPYLYNIWVCDGCGFAADEKVFLSTLSPVRRERLGDALMEHHVHFEFHEERSVPDGVASLKLAIFCAEVLKASLARQAGLTMRLAWVYRIDGQKDNERETLKKALELYIRSLETERYPIENLTDTMVTYLIGALYAELGERKKAAIYLSNIVGDKESSAADGRLAKDARRLWQELREHPEDDSSEEDADKGNGQQAAKKPADKAEAHKAAAKPKKKSGIKSWF